MTIFQLHQTPDVGCGKIPSSEFSALLNLVIPSDDVLLPPIEMTLLNSSCNPIEHPSLCVMPQSSAIPMLTPQQTIESEFCTNSASPAVLNELVISHNLHVSSTSRVIFEPQSSWIEPLSFIRPHLEALTLENPLELLVDMFTLPLRKNKWPKKSRGTCEVAGCNTKRQSNGRCIRHGGGKRCQVEGCTRGAQTQGRCKRHGGGPRCTVEGCTSSSQGGGLCRTHGGGKLCSAPGCKKGTQRQGKCATHASRKCSVHGCLSIARCAKGLCRRHTKQADEQQLKSPKQAKQLDILL